MSCESSNLSEGRVAPDNDLVLRVTVSADHLVGTPRPGQVTHLETERERGGGRFKGEEERGFGLKREREEEMNGSW